MAKVVKKQSKVAAKPAAAAKKVPAKKPAPAKAKAAAKHVAKAAAKPAARQAAKPAPKVRTAAAEPPRTAGLVRVLEDDGSVLAGRDPGLPKDTLLFLYEQMVQVREFDRRMLMLQR
ncbi:MAG: hypothetical protein IT181_08950, partial [Acidobacteria bacterium]|nr:hypothetical protein [Acidobacteriota bacterium]